MAALRKPLSLKALRNKVLSTVFGLVWSPSLLFANNEVGAWYDPSDFTTMFQDSAGTTPVTAVEQPVGLLLDKSKGGRQSLAVTGWAAEGSGDGTVTVVGNTITITGATTTTRVDLASPGWAVGNYADITVTGSVAGATGSTLFLGGGTAYSTLSGTNTFRNVIASSTLLRLQISTGSATFVVTSRGYVPGNHASQSTAASRPVLSARVNLLTYSEQFDNAAWTKDGCNITQNATTAPDGTLSADLLTGTVSPFRVRQGITSVNGVSYTASLHVQAGTSSNIGIGIINVGGGGTFTFATKLWSGVSGSVTSTSYQELPNGWFLLKVTFLSNTTGAGVGWYVDGLTTAYIWGADLRVTNVGVGLPAYQRVAAATDYDTSGFPLYLKFDGTDDSLATASIDPGAVDKAQVFMGLRKIGSGMLLESSANADTNNGSFYLYTGESGGAELGATLRGTQATKILGSLATLPVSRVETVLLDIAGASRATEIFLRANGSVVSGTGFGAADAGTGNFLAYPLYIGRRAGSSFPLNGQVYSMILRFSAATLSDAQIASTETYVNSKTGAY